MEIRNLGPTLAVIMKTAERNSAAFRAYIQLHLAEESDMAAFLLQIQNLAHSESEGERTAGIPHSSYEPPIAMGAADSSSVSPTRSTARCKFGVPRQVS